MFLDSNIFLYAAGAEHALKAPCRRILRAFAAGEFYATTSVEVVQELLHIMLRRGEPELAVALAGSVIDMFDDLLPVTATTLRRAVSLVPTNPRVQARDLIHAATALDAGITEIVSADRGFDQFAEITRRDPAQWGT